MKNRIILLLGTTLLAAGVSQADVLKLKGQGGVQGMLVSANSSEIVFMDINGEEKTFPVSAVAGIDFAPMPPPPAPAPPPGVLTIPRGTQIVVRTLNEIDGKTATVGARYQATLAEPVGVGSRTAIGRGANCTIEVVSIDQGKGMELRLRNIDVGGKYYSTSTEYAGIDATGTSKQKSAAKRGIGLGALGAGIGALAGGGKGAGIGALVGGGVGAVSAVGAKGKQLNVPSETRLIFTLSAPLPMN
jgi:hypothetical protein